MVDHQFVDAGLAGWYDLLNGSEGRADFAFYLPLVMAAGDVLDVGCGTGALLHFARKAGHTGRLCGLDPASGMLAQAGNLPPTARGHRRLGCPAHIADPRMVFAKRIGTPRFWSRWNRHPMFVQW